MADGPAGFTQGFTCPALLRIPLGTCMASRKGLSPAAARLSRRFRSPYVFHIVVLQPPHCRNRAGLGSSPVARRYWGNHSYFLFLPLLRCFSSRRWLPDWPDGTPPACRVFPFGHPRVKGRLHLAAAFRSLPRPSLYHPKKQDGTRGASLLVRTSLTSLFVSLPLFRVATCH